MEHVLNLVAVHPVTDAGGQRSAATIGRWRPATATRFRGSMPIMSRMVHAILLGRVPRRDVDDLVQDVFVTAYTRIRELREPAAFGGWIATIARNRATDYLRQSREQVELPDELPGGDPIEAETFAVLEVIRGLPEAYRDTLLMRLVEGMSGRRLRTGRA